MLICRKRKFDHNRLQNQLLEETAKPAKFRETIVEKKENSAHLIRNNLKLITFCCGNVGLFLH